MGNVEHKARLLPLLPEIIEHHAVRSGVVVEYPAIDEHSLSFMDTFRATFFRDAQHYINVFSVERTQCTWKQIGVSETREISIPVLMFEKIIADGLRTGITIYDAARYPTKGCGRADSLLASC